MAGDLAVTIGRRIAARRTEMKLTQGALAAKVGSDAVNNQRISDWERGVNKPSDRYMQEIADALERPVAWFFEDGQAETPDLMAALPSNSDTSSTQLDRIERKLDRLIRHFEVGEYPDPPADLVSEPPAPKPSRRPGQRQRSGQGKGAASGGAG